MIADIQISGICIQNDYNDNIHEGIIMFIIIGTNMIKIMMLLMTTGYFDSRVPNDLHFNNVIDEILDYNVNSQDKEAEAKILMMLKIMVKILMHH